MEIPGVLERVPTTTQPPAAEPQVVYVTVTVPVTVTVYVTPTPTATTKQTIGFTPIHTATTVHTTTATPTPTVTPSQPLTTGPAVNGTLQINTAAGATGNTFKVYIISDVADKMNNTPISYDEYGLRVINPGYLAVDILANGDSELISLAPGNYLAYLPDKLSDQDMEVNYFTINSSSLTTIHFDAYSYHNVS